MEVLLEDLPGLVVLLALLVHQSGHTQKKIRCSKSNSPASLLNVGMGLTQGNMISIFKTKGDSLTGRKPSATELKHVAKSTHLQSATENVCNQSKTQL